MIFTSLGELSLQLCYQVNTVMNLPESWEERQDNFITKEDMAKLSLVLAIAGFLHKAIRHLIPDNELYMKSEPDTVKSYSRSLMFAWYTLHTSRSYLSQQLTKKKENTRREQRAGRKKKNKTPEKENEGAHLLAGSQSPRGSRKQFPWHQVSITI